MVRAAWPSRRASLRECEANEDLCALVDIAGADPMAAALLIECRGKSQRDLDARIAEVSKVLEGADFAVGANESRPRRVADYPFFREVEKYKVFWDVRKGLIPIVGAAREDGAPPIWCSTCQAASQQSSVAAVAGVGGSCEQLSASTRARPSTLSVHACVLCSALTARELSAARLRFVARARSTVAVIACKFFRSRPQLRERLIQQLRRCALPRLHVPTQ